LLDSSPRKKVAVIGTGIAGLAAAWRTSLVHDVTVFEARATLGGHANTARIDLAGAAVAVDTGFIVFNPLSYPNFCAMLDHFDLASAVSDMSFSASVDDGDYEYSSDGIGGIFAQKRNILRPRMWAMLADLVRLYRSAPEFSTANDAETLDSFLEAKGYSDAFRNDHILPMCAAIWSSPVETMRHYPVRAFFDFFNNHRLLQFSGRPEWRTIPGGSVNYVERLRREISGKIELGCPVRRVRRTLAGVELVFDNDRSERFDDVIMACHSDQAIACLENDATPLERNYLGDIAYQTNTAYLHRDTTFMPCRRQAWASWNYRRAGRVGSDAETVSLTYWMNRLQPLDTSENVFVTLNPDCPPDPEHILRVDTYAHPVFDAAAIRAQKNLHTLQGQQNVWFCGAWLGSGFHEDGLQAGLAVAEALGAPVRPWRLDGATDRIHWPDHIAGRSDFAASPAALAS
jgi:predicted NAD/FAD-binding protein